MPFQKNCYFFLFLSRLAENWFSAKVHLFFASDPRCLHFSSEMPITGNFSFSQVPVLGNSTLHLGVVGIGILISHV